MSVSVPTHSLTGFPRMNNLRTSYTFRTKVRSMRCKVG